MPAYICEKCAKSFKQKSGFDDHMKKKNDCSVNTLLNALIENNVTEKVKEAVRQLNPLAEIVLPQDKLQQEAVLQKFFEDLHNLLWNRAGLNPERALEHMTFFFAYRLIEAQADILALPQECRWSYIAGLKNENDLFEAIKKGVSSFRAKPKTKPFFKPHEIQKADIVFEIVRQINRIPLKALQESDTLGNIFEYMLGRGMSTMSDEGQYFTNRTICRLAFKLAYNIKKSLRRADGTLCTFADWFCGTGGFPAEYVKGVKTHLADVDWKKESGAVYCQDMNLSSVTTTLLNMLILTGIPFSGDKIRGSNSFSDTITTGVGAPFPGLMVDYCFMNPPYGGDKSKGKDYKFAYAKKIKAEDGTTSKKFFVNAEIQSIGIEDDDKVSAGVQLAMATLSADGGVCCIVLPQGFFFGSSKKCVELRKKIAEQYKIHYVVDIASGAFLNTGTKTSLMVFQRGVGPTEKVSFIGLDETVLVEATLEELRSKHYSLNYKQYLLQTAVEVEGFEMVKLGDVIELEYGEYITKATTERGDFPSYGGGDASYTINKFNRDSKFVVNKDGMSKQCIRFVPGKFWLNHHGWTFSSKNKTSTTEHYVGTWLLQNQEMVYNLGNGTAQKGMKTTDFLSLQIPLPSIERQQQIVEAIDGWMNLAHQEEVALKILEKQMMFQVKEMGRGQPRVKLGEVCDVNSGQSFRKEDIVDGDVPVIGGGKIVGYHNQSNRPGNEFSITRVGDCCINWFNSPYMLTEHGFAITLKDSKLNKSLLNTIYYHFNNIKDDLILQYDGTAQKLITKTKLRDFDIPTFKLDEITQLQSDFDEIRHKHAKIAYYKAKAQEAILRLIPGAT
jgi:type I restriction enzyme S subunit